MGTKKLLDYKLSFPFYNPFFNLLRDSNRTYRSKREREITLFYTVSNPAKYHKNIYRTSSLKLLDSKSLHWFCKKLIYRMVSCVSISLLLRKLIFHVVLHVLVSNLLSYVLKIKKNRWREELYGFGIIHVSNDGNTKSI